MGRRAAAAAVIVTAGRDLGAGYGCGSGRPYRPPALPLRVDPGRHPGSRHLRKSPATVLPRRLTVLLAPRASLATEPHPARRRRPLVVDRHHRGLRGAGPVARGAGASSRHRSRPPDLERTDPPTRRGSPLMPPNGACTPLGLQLGSPALFRGRSSAGRAVRSQCTGQGFDPPRLHSHLSSYDHRCYSPVCPRLAGDRRRTGRQRHVQALQALSCPGHLRGADVRRVRHWDRPRP